MRLLKPLVRNLFRRPRVERELDEELRFHVEAETEAGVRRGMPPEEARRRAILDLGGVEQTKERVRGARRGHGLETFWIDLRHGARLLARNPGFTIVVVMTLALGIGANTAIFSLVNGILLRPLPYAEPGRLAAFLQSYPSVGLDSWGLSPFLYASFRDQSRSFESVAAYTGAGLNLAGIESPMRLKAAYVTSGLFEMLGVRPILGRSFLDGEDSPGKNTVCVLSHDLWQSRFGRDPAVVGRSILLNDAPTVVVGVMPPGFDFPGGESDLWLPLGLDPSRRFGFFLTGLGRLREGVTPAQAEAEFTGIQWSLARQTEKPPPEGADMKMIVTPLQEGVTRSAKKPLLVLFAAVGAILLIACANIANLLLARVTAREREIVLRTALGASPGRLAAQLLTESLLIAAIGAAAGALVAAWLVALIGLLPLDEVPRIAEVRIDTGALAFTAGLALLTGLLFGVIPAFRAYRAGLDARMRDGSRGSSAGSTRGLHQALVAAQVAISIVLLMGAGLLLKSLGRLLTVDPGFRTDHLLTMRLSLAGQKYGSRDAMARFHEALAERVRGLPGVSAAGLVSDLPIESDGWSDGYVVEGREAPGSVPPNAMIRVGLPGYFQAAGIPILRGRDFSEADREDSQPVAIIDEELARHCCPGGDALGRRIRLGWDTSERAWMTIVGVAGSVKHSGLSEPWYPHLYMPFRQSPDTADQMQLAVRISAKGSTRAADIREQVRALDPDLPVFAVRTMDEVIDGSLAQPRLTSLLLGAFAFTALALAAVGIYGVMSLAVGGRIQEFGIRMALGARRRDVFGLVAGQGMRIVAVGSAVGAVIALAAARGLRALLFEVSPADPLTLAAAAALLAVVAFAACTLPARRATLVDPVVALRCE